MTWTVRPPHTLADLVDQVDVSSWRWECQGDYTRIDATLLDRWRRGLGRDPEADRPWQDYIRGLRDAGIPFQRARMLTDPLTEYLRCQLDFSHMNVDAGEDVRWVQQRHAVEVGMPEYDYYLLNDQLVAVLEFSDEGSLARIHTNSEEEVVDQHRRWRDLIWIYAVPHARYLSMPT